MNLRNRKSYHYLQDIDDAFDVEIIDATTNLFLDSEVDVHVPLIGDVAVGIPTMAVQQFEDEIALPKEWVISANDTFALCVTGDSMINAGIDKGDIVIAIIGEEATMKKYMLMGGSVLLISENTSYEPIQMNPEDVQINGKVIGVLKG